MNEGSSPVVANERPSGCVATHPCANPACGSEAKRKRRWGRFCSPRCRVAAWDAAHPRQQLPLQLEPAPKAPRTGALRSFHAQSHVSVPEALVGEKRAARQEDAILEFLRYHDDQGGGFHTRWTPSELHACVEFSSWPVTSVRRALTNLTAKGLLQHFPAHRRPGPYGAKESTWGLA